MPRRWTLRSVPGRSPRRAGKTSYRTPGSSSSVLDLPAPTEYFGVRIGLAYATPSGSRTDPVAFRLRVVNEGRSPWRGRVPLVWVQAGSSWVERHDVDVPPGGERSVDLQARWDPVTGPLECRLPTARSPVLEAESTSTGAREWTYTSPYLRLASIGDPRPTGAGSAAEDRSDRLVQTAIFAVVIAAAAVAVVVFVLYATAIL